MRILPKELCSKLLANLLRFAFAYYAFLQELRQGSVLLLSVANFLVAITKSWCNL